MTLTAALTIESETHSALPSLNPLKPTHFSHPEEPSFVAVKTCCAWLLL